MPFTLDGEWIPTEAKSQGPKKPVKVRLVKRGQSILTLILNLDLPSKDMVEISSKIKKKLGCGGGVKKGEIEIQGDKVDPIQKILKEMNIKSS